MAHIIPNFIKKGQVWKSKDNGITFIIIGKNGGNRHWTTKRIGKQSGKPIHKMHEGTILKFYEQLK